MRRTYPSTLSARVTRAQLAYSLARVSWTTSSARCGSPHRRQAVRNSFARRAANRVVFMSDGQIVEEATPEQFFTNPKSERAKDFLGKILSH